MVLLRHDTGSSPTLDARRAAAHNGQRMATILDERLTLTTSAPLEIMADTVVVEDSGWLTAARGLAAALDSRHAELKPQREAALSQHGGSYAPGSALVCRVSASGSQLRLVIWAITYSYAAQRDSQAERHLRATPLDVTQACVAALRQAAAAGARHVVMQALGTRNDIHVLPPVPKKLPRYVMGAAQLAGVYQALEACPSIERITLCLTQRDFGIFHELLGHKAPDAPSEDEIDE